MTLPINCEPLKTLIRTVPDFPKPGILFYDITTVLKDKAGFATLIDAFAQYYIGKEIDLVLGIEARGFIFGPALAYRLNAGFVPVRKPKKLPAPVEKVQYDLEYGSDSLEIHADAILPGQRVIIVDDLLAMAKESLELGDTGGRAGVTTVRPPVSPELLTCIWVSCSLSTASWLISAVCCDPVPDVPRSCLTCLAIDRIWPRSCASACSRLLIATVWLGQRLKERFGTWNAALLAGAAFVVAAGLAGSMIWQLLTRPARPAVGAAGPGTEQVAAISPGSRR